MSLASESSNTRNPSRNVSRFGPLFDHHSSAYCDCETFLGTVRHLRSWKLMTQCVPFGSPTHSSEPLTRRTRSRRNVSLEKEQSHSMRSCGLRNCDGQRRAVLLLACALSLRSYSLFSFSACSFSLACLISASVGMLTIMRYKTPSCSIRFELLSFRPCKRLCSACRCAFSHRLFAPSLHIKRGNISL